MSLLIDALKKHRQGSESAAPSSAASIDARIPMSKVKKAVLIGSITVIVVSLTAIISFFLFKHIEKKRISQVIQAKTNEVQKIKTLLARNAGDATSSSAQPGGILREKLQEKIAQAQANNDSATVSPQTEDSDTDGTSIDTDISATTPATPVAAPPGLAKRNQLRNRLAQRAASNSANNTPNSPDSDSDDSSSASDSASASDSDSDSTADSDTASSSDADSNSNDPVVTTSDDSSSMNEANISMNDDDSTSDTSADDNVSSSTKKVDIEVVPDQLGANNATYQKALSYMQSNQYSQALALLEDNDDVLLKTQSLSALLLARIYLTTGQYVLANDALDRALALHAGSDVELIGLKAQVLFMQKQYQEVVDTLSQQSPDLSTSPEYYTLLANAYMHLNQPASAASVFEQIVARFPDSANYWLGLAVAYQKNGDANSALVAYHRAAQLSSDDPQVMLFINRQIALLQMK